MKKIFYLVLVLFVHQIAYGMLYRGGGVTPPETVFLIPIPTSEDLKSLKPNNSSYEKIPLLWRIAEKSNYITNFQQMDLSYDLNSEEDRLRNGKEIFVKTDYPEGLKALAKLYAQEDQNKPVTLGVKELSSLVRSNLIDFLDLPKPKKDPQELLVDAVKDNPSGGIGSFFELNDGEGLGVGLVQNLIGDLVREKGIDKSLLYQYSEKLCRKGKNIINKHASQFEKEGILREDLLYFDGDIRIYGTILNKITSRGILYYDKFVIVDKDDNRSYLIEELEYPYTCSVGNITIIPSPDKLFYLIKKGYGVSCSSFVIDAKALRAV